MTYKKPNLISAIAIGVSSMVGSGWLFACYYASKQAGPASLVSWLIGAGIALVLAFLLSEIVTMFQETGLFARLLTLTHNRDYGFIIAISNWLGILIIVPSEAEATMQYLSTAVPSMADSIFMNGHLTGIGIACVLFLIFVYWVLNYWGMRTLAKTNNAITLIKVVVPVGTALAIMAASFHPGNFEAYKHSFMPYGAGPTFDAVVNGGIFYAFFGFNLIATYAKELKNPKKNLPIALITSIIITLAIYLLLQFAFIGVHDPSVIAKGWHQLNFTSPLAELAQMLGLNTLMVILYADAAISPSGTAVIMTGSGSRMLTGMSIDKQMPSFLSIIHDKYDFSRRSLAVTVLLSASLLFFFDSWQTIMVLVSVFMIISCVAVPLAFARLRLDKPKLERSFIFRGGNYVCPFIYVFLTYLLAQADVKVLIWSLVLHVIFFAMYVIIYYRSRVGCMLRAFYSCWSMFLYLALSVVFGYLHKLHVLTEPWILAGFLVIAFAMYFVMLNQKGYQKKLAD